MEYFSRELILTDEDFHRISNLVFQESGIYLDESKKSLVKARLARRMRECGISDFSSYCDFVDKDSSRNEIKDLIDAVSTNVTSFFREADHFKFLEKNVIPLILAAKKAQAVPKIRMWSCAVSSGEELYSMVIAAKEALGQARYNLKALGTDISTKALAGAKTGRYPQDKLKEVPLHVTTKYFLPLKEDPAVYMPVEDVRQHCFFARLNLVRDDYPFSGRFDVIFCRNVMIYFNRQTQKELLAKLCRFLEPGGFLFVGHSESLLELSACLKSVASAVYRKER